MVNKEVSEILGAVIIKRQQRFRRSASVYAGTKRLPRGDDGNRALGNGFKKKTRRSLAGFHGCRSDCALYYFDFSVLKLLNSPFCETARPAIVNRIPAAETSVIVSWRISTENRTVITGTR